MALAAEAVPEPGPGPTRPERELLTTRGCEWVRQLGRGQYGTAHLVRAEGREAVAKVVFLENLKERDRSLALQEVEVLKRLDHPNVVRHYFSWLHEGSAGQEALVNIMELCADGDLRHWLESCAQDGRRLAEPLVLGLFAQMLAGIRYVHSQRVLHRDIKTSNMLLTQDRRVVKIGDFGIARVLENTTAVAVTMLGTPYYMSPEVCRGEPYHQKSDMWSLGCVLYEMCCLRHAFESQSLLGLVYCIVSEPYDPLPDGLYSSVVTDLVARLLSKTPDVRPTAGEALALEPLRSLCGTGGEPGLAPEAQTLPAAAPPPPPPQARSHAPEPPPSPSPQRLSSPSQPSQRLVASPQRRPSPAVGSMEQRPPPPPPPPAERPRLPLLTGAGRRAESPPRPGGGERCLSPARGPALLSAPGGRYVRGPAPMQVGYEAQVLLARVRNALLRRPRALGNWVQAFVLHDTTGQGMLSAIEFTKFLESLAVGLSHREACVVTECLLGENQRVSLGNFSDALTHAVPSDSRYSESWAAERADAVAGAAPGGLSNKAGMSLAEALRAAPQQLRQDVDVERLSVWLPKTPKGSIDWEAAEEWRTSAVRAPLR